MAVYTSLTLEQIDGFLHCYQLPGLSSYQGIAAGIENTNYLISTAAGSFILTVYEHFTASEVQPYLSLLQQLSKLENYYPEPLEAVSGDTLQEIEQKPAALFKCLAGCSVNHASELQIAAIAEALAKLHLASPQLSFAEKNPKGFAWMQQAAEKVSPLLSKEDRQLLVDELYYQRQLKTEPFTQGIIHADLFKDNALFLGDNLTGFLDFYAACYDVFLLDIAVAVNDWCVDEQGNFQQEQYKNFVRAYQQIKPLKAFELEALPGFLRRACLRFWLSRLEHQKSPKVGEISLEKSPERFRDLLRQHRLLPLS
ncbi:MAG: homoserine kinase [Methyloprofundus sp.]|nr:homoserine kinase [Methyloprofundus sp.]